MTFPSFGRDNPFFQGFETDPEGQRANYFGRLQARQFKSPNQRKYFQNQFESVQNRYLGHLGNIIQGGGAPTTSLTDYLSSYFAPGGGAEEDWRQEAYRRGNGGVAAPTRWML